VPGLLRNCVALISRDEYNPVAIARSLSTDMDHPVQPRRPASVLERSAVQRIVAAASVCAGLWLGLWLVMS